MRLLQLAIFLVAIVSTFSAYAEPDPAKKHHKKDPDITVGIKLGMNVQRTFGSNVLFKGSYSQGVMGGAFGSWTKKNMAVRAELLLKKAKLDYLPYHATIKCFYLDVPVLFEYLIFERIWLQAGPQYTRMISARNTGMGSGSNVRAIWFQSNDIALAGGAEVLVTPKLTATLRYVHGLLDVNGIRAVDNGRWKNSGLQITAGYFFFN